MKVILNKCYGGFGIKESVEKELGLKPFSDDSRYNKTLISMIEAGIDCNNEYSDLKVVEIPDNITDMEFVEEDDGWEEIIYVLDGKIHHV